MGNTYFTPGLTMRRAIGLEDSCANCKFRNTNWMPFSEEVFCQHHAADPAPSAEQFDEQGCDLHERVEES